MSIIASLGKCCDGAELRRHAPYAVSLIGVWDTCEILSHHHGSHTLTCQFFSNREGGNGQGSLHVSDHVLYNLLGPPLWSQLWQGACVSARW